MILCFVFCLMAQVAVSSAAQFFKFYFVLLEFSLAITFLGILIVVISPLPQVSDPVTAVLFSYSVFCINILSDNILKTVSQLRMVRTASFMLLFHVLLQCVSRL